MMGFFLDSLYAAIILATLLLNASVPLYFEMACEATYPVAEGITNFVLTLVNNIGGLVFLLVNMIPNIGIHNLLKHCTVMSFSCSYNI